MSITAQTGAASFRIRRRLHIVYPTNRAIPRHAREVTELVFRGSVSLPATTTFRTAAGWSTFYNSAT